jgi:MoaA/NifB/PqqE/SkfB family radical SAM enzyme
VKLPDFVQIEPVGQCNLACRMCPVAYRGQGGGEGGGEGGVRGEALAFMSYDTFCRVLDQFPEIRHLQLQGMGEPFLHPRLFDMVRYAAARGIEVSTNSNLTALSSRRAEECVASGLAKLHVSIDAADPDAYAYIRVGSQLARVLRNLDLIQAAKERSGASSPEIILVCVDMRRNLEQLPRLVHLAAAHGARSISAQHLAHDFTEDSLPAKYQPMRAFVDAETLLAEDPVRIERSFAEARRAADEAGVALRLPNIAKRGPRGCDWPWRGAYLSFSGEAMPCCMIATPDRLNFGNVVKDGVAAVWNNEPYNAFRARLASDDPPEICRGCALYNGTF